MVPQQVSFVERLSLSQRVPYQRFHCISMVLQLSVLCREVVPISEGPLSEVPLHSATSVYISKQETLGSKIFDRDLAYFLNL